MTRYAGSRLRTTLANAESTSIVGQDINEPLTSPPQTLALDMSYQLWHDIKQTISIAQSWFWSQRTVRTQGKVQSLAQMTVAVDLWL